MRIIKWKTGYITESSISVCFLDSGSKNKERTFDHNFSNSAWCHDWAFLWILYSKKKKGRKKKVCGSVWQSYFSQAWLFHKIIIITFTMKISSYEKMHAVYKSVSAYQLPVQQQTLPLSTTSRGAGVGPPFCQTGLLWAAWQSRWRRLLHPSWDRTTSTQLFRNSLTVTASERKHTPIMHCW